MRQKAAVTRSSPHHRHPRTRVGHRTAPTRRRCYRRQVPDWRLAPCQQSPAHHLHCLRRPRRRNSHHQIRGPKRRSVAGLGLHPTRVVVAAAAAATSRLATPGRARPIHPHHPPLIVADAPPPAAPSCRCRRTCCRSRHCHGYPLSPLSRRMRQGCSGRPPHASPWASPWPPHNRHRHRRSPRASQRSAAPEAAPRMHPSRRAAHPHPYRWDYRRWRGRTTHEQQRRQRRALASAEFAAAARRRAAEIAATATPAEQATEAPSFLLAAAAK